MLAKLKRDEGRVPSGDGAIDSGDCTGFDFFKYTLINPLVRIYNSGLITAVRSYGIAQWGLKPVFINFYYLSQYFNKHTHNHMADDSKKQIKWTIILLGLVAIGYYFYPQGEDLMPDDLSSKTVTLSLDIKMIHSTHSSSSYRQLWTNETKAAFTIASPGNVVAPDGSLDSLKKGDTLTVKYYKINENELNNGVNEIPIYYLQKGRRVYFELASYNKVKDATTFRIKVIAIISGILMLLYGFNVIDKKTTWIAAGAGVALFIILRALNKF